MDSRIRDQIGLEFGQVDVQSNIKSQRNGGRRDNLSDQSVQVDVSESFNIQISSADIVDSFVIEHESTVGMFQGGVGCQNGVVRFDNGGRDGFLFVA